MRTRAERSSLRSAVLLACALYAVLFALVEPRRPDSPLAGGVATGGSGSSSVVTVLLAASPGEGLPSGSVAPSAPEASAPPHPGERTAPTGRLLATGVATRPPAGATPGGPAERSPDAREAGSPVAGGAAGSVAGHGEAAAGDGASIAGQSPSFDEAADAHRASADRAAAAEGGVPAGGAPLAEGAGSGLPSATVQGGNGGALSAATDGGGVSRSRIAALLALIRERIERERVYPLAARLRGIEGTVTASVTVSSMGSLASERIVASSGSAILDRAGIALLRRIFPVPDATGSSFTLEVRIDYRLLGGEPE